MSATEKRGRRHTSFVLVHEVSTSKRSIVLRDSDLRIDTFRGSGPGGQHRNKTDSAVRMVHEPTGLTVTATEERSQHQNRKVARARMEAKLSGGIDESHTLLDQQWNWCEWRNQVTLPDGTKRSMSNLLRKGLDSV